jgi:hypothetical protein
MRPSGCIATEAASVASFDQSERESSVRVSAGATALCGGDGLVVRKARRSGDRGEEYDAAALAPHHLRHDRFHRNECARCVDFERRAPVLERQRVQRPQHDAADRMYQPIDGAGLFFDARTEGRKALDVEHVACIRGHSDAARDVAQAFGIARHEHDAVAACG